MSSEEKVENYSSNFNDRFEKKNIMKCVSKFDCLLKIRYFVLFLNAQLYVFQKTLLSGLLST